MEELKDIGEFESFDINKKLNIPTVSDNFEDAAAEDTPATANKDAKASSEAKITSLGISSPPRDGQQARRRTRGVSLLSVRQSNEPFREAQPHTPSPLRAVNPRGSQIGSTPGTPANSANVSDRGLAISANSSASKAPDNFSSSAPKGGEFSSVIDNMPVSDRLLSTYINQLAVKEARVGDLRVALSSLQQELHEAEAELNHFRNNGQKLADMVHRGETGDLPTLGSPDGRNIERRPSTSDSQKDVLGIGKRVVDEIGTQFWSFLEDVKSATLGNVDFEDLRPNQKSPHLKSVPHLPPRPSTSNPLSPKLPPRPASPGIERPSSPPRRQLSPKRSIQNFMRNRAPSPVRSLSPSRSARRQEIAEHHATQRLRESERLTRKLSNLDLRARAAQDSNNESITPNNS